MIDRTILHYEILEKLGEGGMGEVYKAHDTKLDRFVALKFLPSQLTATESEKSRFIQEAKAASALNHPNVCTIYDIQEFPSGETAGDRSEGQLFIVMEYVDGETLRGKHNLSIKQVIDAGAQAAEGLAAAHEKGIVHRDIKPENIMVTKSGVVKVMDFGLAKLNKAEEASRLTKAGTTLGTVGYMSPEQVQGQDVDHRSDIFSLGVVLYELLCGESPFKGVHETAIMYEIVNVDPPPLSTVKAEISSELDDIILECLEKEKDDRCQSAKELAKDLRKVRKSTGYRRSRAYDTTGQGASYVSRNSTSGGNMSSGSRAGGVLSSAKLLLGVSFLSIAAALIFGLLYFGKASGSGIAETRSSVLLPRGVDLTDSYHGSNIAISPNGKYIAFVGTDSAGETKLWLRPVNSLQAKPIAPAYRISLPFWSPDSKYIAYFLPSKLNKISITGGQPITICDAPGGAGGTWGSNGTILFIPNYLGGIYEVSADGGKPRSLISLGSHKNWGGLRWPHFLPDGKHFLFTTIASANGVQRQSAEGYALYGASLDNPKARLVMKSPTNAGYSDGFLFFVRQKMLFARRFDPSSFKFTGESIPVASGIQYYPGDAAGVFSISDDGTIVYQHSGRDKKDIVLMGKDGKIERSLFTRNIAFRARFSPGDGKIVFDSYSSGEGSSDIWIHDISRGITTRFTFDPSMDNDPLWSPDGRRIIFSSARLNDHFELLMKNADGSGHVRQFFAEDSNRVVLASDWSRDGKYIAVDAQNYEDKKSGWDILVIPTFGDRKPIKFLATNFDEVNPRFSPDTKWVAYASNETGTYQIFVSPFSGGGKWQVSNVQGLEWGPKWVDSGRQIYFATSDYKIWSVDVVEKGSTLSLGKPQLVLDYSEQGRDVTIYDVNKKGNEFLAGVPSGGQTSSSITMITNWRQEVNDAR